MNDFLIENILIFVSVRELEGFNGDYGWHLPNTITVTLNSKYYKITQTQTRFV